MQNDTAPSDELKDSQLQQQSSPRSSTASERRQRPTFSLDSDSSDENDEPDTKPGPGQKPNAEEIKLAAQST